MEESLRMDVSLTSQDIKDIYFSQIYRDYPKRKPSILSNIAFGIIMFIDVLSILLLLGCVFIRLFFGHSISFSALPISVYQYISILSVINFLGGVKCIMLLNYFFAQKRFKENNLSGMPVQYEFSDDGIKIISKINNCAYDWNVVYRVKSLPMHFMICVHQGLAFVIPKRVFKHQEELDRFLRIITKNVEPIKLQLKGCKIDQVDFDEESINNLSTVSIDAPSIDTPSKEVLDSDEKSLEYFSFRLNKSMCRNIAFTIYIKSRYGKVITFLGIIFFVTWLFNIKNIDLDNLFAIYVLTILCIIVSLIPYRLVRDMLKDLERADKADGCNIAYNTNLLILYLPEGDMKIEWKELLEVKEYKAFYLLNISPRIFYPIPKSIFNSESEKLKQLKEIISSKCK